MSLQIIKPDSLQKKVDHLISQLQNLEKVVIGFSGGVDSTLLSYIAANVLAENALCVSIISEFITQDEDKEIDSLAQELDLNLSKIKLSVLGNENIAKNDKLRCKYCKEAIVATLKEFALKYDAVAILDGANTDDLSDYRPGLEAAKKLGVISPFIDASISKSEIREIAKQYKIPIWDKPAAACLASRIPYNTKITNDTLERIEKAEKFVKELGYKGFRVRDHANLARVELQHNDISRFIDQHSAIVTEKLKELGYTFVCLDLAGYRTGSLNEEVLKNNE